MDLRPQAHDIIRTWLFDSVLRSHLEHDSLPWTHAAISGWVLDPDRKKMSKSKGNVVTPIGAARRARVRRRALLGRERTAGHRHGLRHQSDARRPAAGDQGAERVAVRARRRRAAGRDHGAGRPRDAAETSARSSTKRPTRSRRTTTRASLQRTETFFWRFCDDYLELVKGRRYGDQGAAGAGVGKLRARRGAVGAAAAARAVPAVCDRRSVVVVAGRLDPSGARGRDATRSSRCSPTISDAARMSRRAARTQWATEVLFEVRKQRSEAKQPLKVPITHGDGAAAQPIRCALMPIVEADLKSALRVQAFDVIVGEPRDDQRGRLRDAAPA